MSIYLGEGKEYSDMQGPAPDGFHVPLSTEWQAIYDAYTGLGLSGGTNFSTYLKMPMAGNRMYYKDITGVGSDGRYWSSSPYASNANAAHSLRISASNIYPQDYNSCSYGFSVRCFKDSPTTPTSSWTVLYQGSGSAGIFHNATEGLISISSDGTTWITIMDKNLGATTVYNYGDTLADANCGNVFQWGNNYAFPGTLSSDSITTSSSQVNAQNYGPGNYYESSTWIQYNGNWSTPANTNLRGGVSQGSGTKPGIKEVYLGSTKAKAVYAGDIKVREAKREDIRPNLDLLYSGASGTIYHGYNNNKGEIKIKKTNGDFVIIADRNIGAINYYTYGDTLSQNNCGYYFQWGNNHGFPWTGAPEKKTSSQVYASTYGPGNYYDDDTYFTWLNNWDRSYNANLWGGQNDTDLSKKGPCDNGYHIPSLNEWSSLKSFMENIVGSNRLDNSKYLLLPFAGQRFYYSDAEIRDQGTTGNYRCSSASAYPLSDWVQSISINSSSMSLNDYIQACYGFSIRPFKNT